MSDRDALHEALLDHSDSRACRLVWESLEGTGSPEDLSLRDYVEAMRATGGAVCLVASEQQADLYVRYDGGEFVHAAFWPPGSVVDGGVATEAELLDLLADRDGPQPVHVSKTPFASGGLAAGPI